MSSAPPGGGKPPSNGGGAPGNGRPGNGSGREGPGDGHAAQPAAPASASTTPPAATSAPPAADPAERKGSGRQVRCPQCSKPAFWDGNPSRPFCSERCRLIDLGQWADGTYAIPAEPVPDKGEDEE